MNRALLLSLVVMLLLGAGCRQAPEAPPEEVPTPEFIPRQDLMPPKDAWGAYEHAQTIKDLSSKTVIHEEAERGITLNIPSWWSAEEAARWRPKADDALNHIRAQYVAFEGAETQWNKQQNMPELQDVVHAEKRDTDYLLLLNHKGLKTTMVQRFFPDPEHPGDGFFFIECRIAWDAEHPEDLWNACKTAMESARVGIVNPSDL